MGELIRYEGWANPPLHKFTTRMKERSLEELMAEEPDEVEAVHRAFERIVKGSVMARTIDTGDFPFEHYSSGEKKKVRKWDRVNHVSVEEEVLVGIPIKNLRRGVLYTVFDERTYLGGISEGLKGQADEMINTARAYEKKP